MDSALSSSYFALVVFEEGATDIPACDFTLGIQTYLFLDKPSVDKTVDHGLIRHSGGDEPRRCIFAKFFCRLLKFGRLREGANQVISRSSEKHSELFRQ
jgi:hypothetical protein